MPFVAVAVLAAGVAAVEGATLLTIGLTFVGSIVMSFIGQALQPKPPTPNVSSFASQARDRTQMVRQPITTRRIVYGTTRASGPITFLNVPAGNQNLDMLVTVAGHEVAAMRDPYFADELVPLDGSGNATGHWQSYASVHFGLGSTDGDAGLQTALQANASGYWTAAHKQTSCAKLHVRLTFNSDLMPGSIPNMSCVVDGRKVYDPRAAAVNVLTSSAASPAVFGTDAAHGLAVGDRVFIRNHAGSTPAIDKEYRVATVPTATSLTLQSPWGEQPVNLTVGGTGGTLSKMAFSRNAALCVADYLCLPPLLGMAAASSEIDWDALVTAANICDETVALGAAPKFIARDTGTVIGDMTGTINGQGQGIASAFDGVLGVSFKFAAWAAGAPGPNGTWNGNSSGYVGKDWGAGVTRKLGRYDIFGAGAAGFLGGVTDGATVNVFLEGSNDGTAWTQLHTDTFANSFTGISKSYANGTQLDANGNVIQSVHPIDDSTAYRYHRVRITTPTAGMWPMVQEVRFFEVYGSEVRYLCDGVLDTADAMETNIGRLLSAMAGQLVRSGDKWVVQAGAWRPPSVTLAEGDCDGPLALDTLISKRDLFNGVKGVYVSGEPDLWNPTDFPVVTNPAYATADGGQIYKDADLPFTMSPSAAQRISKIILQKVRRQMTLKYPAKLTALHIRAGDVIEIGNTRFGFVNKTFEVAGFLFTDHGGKDAPQLGIDLTLRETDANVYAWTSAEEQANVAAPKTALPDPLALKPPAGLTLASGTDQLYLRADGTVFSRIKASWTPPADAFVTSGGQIEIQFKKSVNTAWEKGTIVGGAERFAYLLDVEDGVSYDVRIQAINTLGARSDWTEVDGHTVIGKTAPPANVSGFVAQQNGSLVVFKWDALPDLDAAGVEIRYVAA